MPVTPIEIVREIGSSQLEWANGPLVKANLAASHWRLFGVPLDWPPTNMVLVAEKPMT